MRPVARITDKTSHLLFSGSVAGPGSGSVLAEGVAAGRVLDTAICGFPSHSPGSIQSGAATVLVEGLPAAGTADTLACGGQIAVGAPGVFVGGSQVTIPLNVVGSDAFLKATQRAVAVLYGTRTGRELFAGIAASGHGVIIQETTDPNGYCKLNPPLAFARTPGRGVGSTVSWNPTHPAPGLAGNPHAPAVVLGHELTHAYHAAQGTFGDGPHDHYPGQGGTSNRSEERKTVGSAGGTITQPNGTTAPAPDHSHDVPTENSLRDDLGLPRRPTYYPPTWPGGAPW